MTPVGLPEGSLKVAVADSTGIFSQELPPCDLGLALGLSVTQTRALPRGWIAAQDVDYLVRAIDIRVRSHVAQRIEALAEAPPQAALTASIVICAGRPIASLLPAVQAAIDQDFPASEFEVIVVNNKPDDSGLAESFRGFPDRVRQVPCPIRGHSAARNAGLGAARGRYVCYLDDDSIPERQWLRRLCDAFDAHAETGVIGGPIVLSPATAAPAATKNGWLNYWSHFAPRISGYTEVHDWREFPWGANWSARRSALYGIGGFRLAFGRKNEDHGGGEELAAAVLIQRLGYRIAVTPDASVQHRVDAARLTRAHVRDTMARRHLVAHAAARDGLLDRRSGVLSGLARLLFHHVDPRVRSWPEIAQDMAYRKRAQLRLLGVQWSELRQRWRRPSEPG